MVQTKAGVKIAVEMVQGPDEAEPSAIVQLVGLNGQVHGACLDLADVTALALEARDVSRRMMVTEGWPFGTMRDGGDDDGPGAGARHTE